jgi:hypothetical protein
MTKAFISYSHQDERALLRLHKHMSMLTRTGELTTWYDRKITPGNDLDKKIRANLDDSDLFLALVSADFLASDYCYNEELQEALRRHEEGSIQVIPIIVEPCDWQKSPLGKLLALPTDGKAISLWTNENVAYLDIINGLRQALASLQPRATNSSTNIVESAPEKAGAHQSKQRKYRIKKDFDSIDKEEFREKAYSTIRQYFEASVSELNQIGGDIRARFEDMPPSAFTCTVVNKARTRGEGHITVHSSRSGMMGEITYSFSLRAQGNSANGFVHVEADEYEMYLKLDSLRWSRNDEEKMTAERVAEQLWVDFLAQAGVTYD